MKKRIVSILMAAALVSALFAGCGKKEDSGKSSGGKETLVVGIPQNTNITSYDDNALTNYIEESLDIELQFEFFSPGASDYSQQFSLLCVGGETLPDVLVGFTGLGEDAINTYGEDGFFLDLTELIDEYAVNYKAQLAKLSEEEQAKIELWTTSLSTGEIYGMPTYGTMTAPDNMQSMMLINKTWLEAVNMEAPKTVDELYDVLKAFATQDPNGNGEADEIPMLGTSDSYGKTAVYYILNAFEYMNVSDPFNVEDGKVYSAMSSDEYRQGLEFVNKLVAEDLFSDMSFTLKSTDAKALISPMDQVAKVGIWAGHPEVVTSPNCQILDQYVALAPLEDATGKGGYGVVNETSVSVGAFITEDCENVETAMKFLDFFYADETVVRARHGEKDVDWVEAEGTSTYGYPAHLKVVNANAYFSGNSTWNCMGCSISTYENYEPARDETDEVSGRTAETTRIFKEWFAMMQEFDEPEEMAADIRLTTLENDNINSTSWSSYITEARTLFCLGTKDPGSDADWNEYLTTLEKYGESRITGIIQGAYDRTVNQ